MVTNKDVYVVPLEDARIQIIVIPERAYKELHSMTLSDKVRTLMKDINPEQIKKLQSLTIPSFKLSIENQPVSSDLTSLKIQEDDGLKISGGNQTADIELISGLPARGAPRQSLAGPDEAIINEPFIFALYDQELELNQIDNALVLAVQVETSDWIKL